MTSKFLELAQLLEEAAKALREADEKLTAIPNITRTSIFQAGLSIRARKVLYRLGCEFFEQAADFYEDQLLAIKNCGPTVVDEVREKLGRIGLCLTGDNPQSK